MREIAQRPASVRPHSKIAQQIFRPIAGAGRILPQSDAERAVSAPLETQLRLPQDDARRCDNAHQRRAQAEPERYLRQRKLRIAVAAPQAHAAGDDVNGPALLQTHQSVIDARDEPRLGAGYGVGDVGAEEVEGQRSHRQAPDEGSDEQRRSSGQCGKPTQ